MLPFRFDPQDLPPPALELQKEVRAFLDETLRDYPAELRARTWTGFDADFSRKLGAQGWIGLPWPKAYGGHERTALERYVLLEELLVAGAPVAAHWIGDRQSGPLLLKYGTEEQRQFFLPKIAAGEMYFCIGMSEPNSGSDLASVRTKAEKVDGGYLVNGSKLWTTHGHRCHTMIALFRTDPKPDKRHDGLTQFLVDLSSKGITRRPIYDHSGGDDFSEVIFEDAFVPQDRLVGEEGNGWAQVMSELAFERSGPERYLSSFVLMQEMMKRIGGNPSDQEAAVIGRLTAHITTLRRMSLSVAGTLERGENPSLEASVVKDLGAVFEQQMPNIAHDLIGADADPEGADSFERVMAYVTQASVSFSLRGGTREILRGIIARGMGLR
jgi:alkylation response protein AidB-like acyl-CoA dehydrogenase